MAIHRILSTGKWCAILFASALLAAPASAQHWEGSWGAAPHMARTPENGGAIVTYAGATLRQTIRISAGGDQLRVRLSNELSANPQRIGQVTVAVVGSDGKLRGDTMRKVTFAGTEGAVIGVGAPLVSDPVALKVDDLSILAISIYLPEGLREPTVHNSAYVTGWSVEGAHATDLELKGAESFTQRFLVSGVDVETPTKLPVIVTFGDSITDGTRTTVDQNRRWPDRLAERLQHEGKGGFAVVNAGIGGNRLLEISQSPSALARFDRDVLAVPGISHLIVLLGVNDIGTMQPAERDTKAARLIGGYRQLIARARARGIRIYLATIIPFKGAKYWSAEKEVVRKQVNSWIRNQTEADGVFDFDRAMQDSTDPDRMRAAFDSGDDLHPNDAGMAAMADAVDLHALG